MNGYQAYVMYLALKRHFTSDYDYHRYNGKVTASPSSYEKRRDKWLFEKLAKHPDPEGLVVSCMANDSGMWIGDILNEKGQAIHDAFRKEKQSLTYRLMSDLRILRPRFNDNFTMEDGGYPYLLTAYLGGRISMISFASLCAATGCLDHWRISDPIWEGVRQRITKVIPFLSIDRNRVAAAVREIFYDGER